MSIQTSRVCFFLLYWHKKLMDLYSYDYNGTEDYWVGTLGYDANSIAMNEKSSRNQKYVKDCNLKRCNWTEALEGVKEGNVHALWWHWCGTTGPRVSTFCKWQRQTWWSHADSVQPAVRHLLDVFLLFLLIPGPAYQIHSFSSSRWCEAS